MSMPLVVLLALSAAAAAKRQATPALFAAAGLAGLASFAMQGTGFKYQVIPLQAFSLIGLAWIVLDARRPDPVTLCAVALLGAGLAGDLIGGFYQNAVTDDLARRIAGRRSVATFSSDLPPGPPVALEARAVWASRYPALWYVPGAINRLNGAGCRKDPAACRDLDAVLALTRAHIAEDLTRYAPDIIVFDRHSPFFGTGQPPFDWRAFMDTQPDFQRIMERYAYAQEAGRFEIWARTR